MDKTLKIAAFQMNIAWESPLDNILKVEQMVSKSDAELVILPEMFATGFSMVPSKIAQPDTGEIVTRISALASKTGKAIIGSIAIKVEKCPTWSCYLNRLFFFHPNGTCQTYDKRHTFRMGGEHLQYKSGNRRIIIKYKGFRICPLICYDLRFPVWSRNRDDYDLLVYVANWPDTRKHVWSSLLVARAIENLSYCVGANRCGNDPKNSYSGDSVILDFKGLPLAKTETDQEQVIIAELSMDKLNEFREKFPAYLDADGFEITDL